MSIIKKRIYFYKEKFMSTIFYLAGFIFAGHAGVNELAWYYIFISGAITSLGWFVQRISVCMNLIKEKGIVLFIFQLIPMQIAIFSIICAPIYFVASLFANS